jgi:hypothetical protein
MNGSTSDEQTFSRGFRLRATPIVVAVAIAVAALIRTPGVIVVLIIGTLAYTYAAFLDARTKIVLSTRSLVWSGFDSVVIQHDDVVTCTFKTFHAMGARDGRFFVFLVSDASGQTIPLNQYGWGREQRRALFVQLQEWLTTSRATVDPVTLQRLSDAARR